MIRIRFFVTTVAALTAVLAWTIARAGQTALSQDEQTLKNAGLPSDGPGLVEYFRRRTPTDQEKAILQERARQLGSSVFAVRAKATDALIHAGRASLPHLREIAKSTDGEAPRRAQYCIQVIEQNTQIGLSAAASRVLAERRPAGAAEALLAYLPLAEETWVEEEIRASLKRLAAGDARAVAALEKALADPVASRRGAAGWILGAADDPKRRRQAITLLADSSSEVRFLTAASLLGAHDAAAVPALIALLAGDSAELACRAEDLLFRLAGDQGPAAAWLDFSRDNSGGKARAAWESWWREHHTKIDWNRLDLDEESAGATLVVENQRPDGVGRIFECNRAGQICWEQKVNNPIDAHWLSGGRCLIADSRGGRLFEIDRRGQVLWTHTGIAATSIQRLPGGNTVVSTYQQILEISRDGKTVFSFATQGHTYHARKLSDGQYIWIDACGEIGAVDAKGRVIAKTKLADGLSWGSIERLRNGHYLVALGGSAGTVAEVDFAGKVYWEKAVNNPNRAIRLANGHTLVASHADQCVYEFDAAGKERWKLPCVGRPFAASRGRSSIAASKISAGPGN